MLPRWGKMKRVSIIAAAFWVFAFAAAFAFPQPLAAADIPIACTLTDAEIIWVGSASPEGMSVRKQISETAHFTISDAGLVTPMGAPCDRIAGAIGDMIHASCSFPPIGKSRASIKLQIDRRLGSITQTWDIIEEDGSQTHYSKNGTCTKRQGIYVTENN